LFYSLTIPSPNTVHFRTAIGREVDIVLESSSGDIVGIEVKAGASVTGDDLKGIEALKKVAKSRFKRGIVLYGGLETVPFAENIHAVPLCALWQWPVV
jgi:predicted AAA+ superfamily ATPase